MLLFNKIFVLAWIFSAVHSSMLGSLLDYILPRSRSLYKEGKPIPINGDKHNACRVGGYMGTCMFSWDCRVRGGTAYGICRDGFLFGVCCGSPKFISPLVKSYSELPDGQIVPIQKRDFKLGCGLSLHQNEDLSSRIVNGDNAGAGEFPWQVSLRVVTPFYDTTHWCGAVLLNNYWVITAAHCVKGYRPDILVVRFGSYTTSALFNLKFEDRRVSKVIPHPNFINLEGGFDIALIRMEKKVEFDNFIRPICLPGSIGSLENVPAVATGWGRGLHEDDFPFVLQKAVVPIFSISKCQSLYIKEAKPLLVTPNFICAGYEDGSVDSCHGDSGGPLQVMDESKRWILAGVTSSGYKCGHPNLPGLYTRVSLYVPWIMQNIIY